MLLASQSRRAESVSWVGLATFGGGEILRFLPGVLEGLQPVARLFLNRDSTPASSHQANALRASAMPIGSVSPPTFRSSPPLTPWSRNWQGRRVELCFRRGRTKGNG